MMFRPAGFSKTRRPWESVEFNRLQPKQALSDSPQVGCTNCRAAAFLNNSLNQETDHG
jgi:hypothetical protein